MTWIPSPPRLQDRYEGLYPISKPEVRPAPILRTGDPLPISDSMTKMAMRIERLEEQLRRSNAIESEIPWYGESPIKCSIPPISHPWSLLFSDIARNAEFCFRRSSVTESYESMKKLHADMCELARQFEGLSMNTEQYRAFRSWIGTSDVPQSSPTQQTSTCDTPVVQESSSDAFGKGPCYFCKATRWDPFRPCCDACRTSFVFRMKSRAKKQFSI